MSQPKFFNGKGSEMCQRYFNVPLAYVFKYIGSKQLVVLEATKNKVAYALRNEKNMRVGMVKHTKIMSDKKRGDYFLHRGNRMYLKDASLVF